jgi:hypothetical protein
MHQNKNNKMGNVFSCKKSSKKEYVCHTPRQYCEQCDILYIINEEHHCCKCKMKWKHNMVSLYPGVNFNEVHCCICKRNSLVNCPKQNKCEHVQ